MKLYLDNIAGVHLVSVWVVYVKYDDIGWNAAMVSSTDPRLDDEQYPHLYKICKDSMVIREYELYKAPSRVVGPLLSKAHKDPKATKGKVLSHTELRDAIRKHAKGKQDVEEDT
jgi:hypothetical protein